jgi:hypothetical protein
MKSGPSPSPFPKYGNFHRRTVALTPGTVHDRDRPAAAQDHKGQNTKSAGIDTAMINTSSGNPIRQ